MHEELADDLEVMDQILIGIHAELGREFGYNIVVIFDNKSVVLRCIFFTLVIFVAIAPIRSCILKRYVFDFIIFRGFR